MGYAGPMGEMINYPTTLDAALEAGRYFGRNLASKIGLETEDAEQQASVWALQWWHNHSGGVNIWTFMKRRVADFIRSHPECAWVNATTPQAKTELAPHIAECVECGKEFSQPRKPGRRRARCDECRRIPEHTERLVDMAELCMGLGDCSRTMAWRIIANYGVPVVHVEGEPYVWLSDALAIVQHLHDELLAIASMDVRKLSPADFADLFDEGW